MKIAATSIALLVVAETLLPARADIVRASQYTHGWTGSSSKQNDIATRTKLAPALPGSFSTCDANGPGILSQTQSSEVDESVACTYDEATFPVTTSGLQRWGRCYSLADEGCTAARVITAVTFGVYSVFSRTDEPVDVKVNVYKDDGCLVMVERERKKEGDRSEGEAK